VNWMGRIAALMVAVGISSTVFDSSVATLVPAPVGVASLVVGVALAWRYTPEFWKIVLTALVGGFVAGLLILGPGFRVSMRVVALLEPGRELEFTMGGTLFVILGVGGLLGGVMSITGYLLRVGLGIGSGVVGGLLLGALVLGSLAFGSGDVSTEFFELGAGPWVNFPLFGVFAMAYGIAAMALADRFRGEMFRESRADREKVAA